MICHSFDMQRAAVVRTRWARGARRREGVPMTRRRLAVTGTFVLALVEHRLGGRRRRGRRRGRLDHVLEHAGRARSRRDAEPDHRGVHRSDRDRGRARSGAGGRPAQPDRHQRRIGRSARRGPPPDRLLDRLGGAGHPRRRGGGRGGRVARRRHVQRAGAWPWPARTTSRWPCPPTGGDSSSSTAPTCSRRPGWRRRTRSSGSSPPPRRCTATG